MKPARRLLRQTVQKGHEHRIPDGYANPITNPLKHSFPPKKGILPQTKEGRSQERPSFFHQNLSRTTQDEFPLTHPRSVATLAGRIGSPDARPGFWGSVAQKTPKRFCRSHVLVTNGS